MASSATGMTGEGLGIGTIADARENEVGLWGKGEFYDALDAQQARKRSLNRQARGKSVQLSIGFFMHGMKFFEEEEYLALCEEAGYEPSADELRRAKWGALGLTENEPIEFSLVGAAACKGSEADNVKGLSLAPYERQMSATLAAVKECRERAKILRRVLSADNADSLISRRALGTLRELSDSLVELVGAVELTQPSEDNNNREQDTPPAETRSEEPPAKEEPSNPRAASEAVEEAMARYRSVTASVQEALAR
jgi:hypothetical protein